MSQKKRNYDVTFNNGTTVTVTGKGKRIALAKACVQTGLSEDDISSYRKQGAKGMRFRSWSTRPLPRW